MNKFEARPSAGARDAMPSPAEAARSAAQSSAEPSVGARASVAPARASRLGDYLRTHLDAVMADWESFARSLDASGQMTPGELRDHCRAVLLEVADGMDTGGPAKELATSTQGRADPDASTDSAASSHGALRQLSGFDLVQLVSEFSALRAGVLTHWQASAGAGAEPLALDDTIRFNEAIDRALAASVKSYASHVAASRDMALAVLGHDLRGPLEAIDMSVLVLGKLGLGEAPRLMAAARVHRAATEMDHLITDLLEFTQSRLGGGIPIRRVACDIGLTCADVIESVGASHPGRSLKFQPLGDLVMMADEHRLQQVVSNLLHNVVQQGDPQDEVSLLARGDVDDVLLEVRNSGHAIPEEALPFIFEPRVQAAAGDEASAGEWSRTSLGLGLFVAREIVRGHGGSITVASRRRAGTVFTVRLPRGGGPSSGASHVGSAGTAGWAARRW